MVPIFVGTALVFFLKNGDNGVGVGNKLWMRMGFALMGIGTGGIKKFRKKFRKKKKKKKNRRETFQNGRNSSETNRCHTLFFP
jgi:hypothetical protein